MSEFSDVPPSEETTSKISSTLTSTPNASPRSSGLPSQQSFGPYLLIKTIGVGEFGKVKLATHKETERRVAIKLVKKLSVSDPPKRAKLDREISVLRAVSHPFIVKLLQVIETSQHIGIVLEYAAGGELFEYIFKNKYLKECEARRFFGQLVSGVSFLHSIGFVHRDLKLENILVSGSGDLVITDFGFATGITDALLVTSCGSPCYAAPELVIANGYAGEPADIWSLGVILYAMLSGFLPYDDDPLNPDGENINLLYKYIIESTLPFPSHISSEAVALLQRILVADPAKRISIEGIVMDEWMDAQRITIKSCMQKYNRDKQMKDNQTASEETIQNIPDEDDFVAQTSALIIGVPSVDLYRVVRPPSPAEQLMLSMKKSLPLLPFTAENELPSPSNPSQQQPKTSTVSAIFNKAKSTLSRINQRVQGDTPPLTPPRKVTIAPSIEAQDEPDYQTRQSVALSRTSFAASYAASQYSIMQSNFEFTGRLPRLRYHQGATDRRAITAKEPMGIVLDVEEYLLGLGYEVLIDSGKIYRLNVVRPRGFVKRARDEVFEEDRAEETYSKEVPGRELQFKKEKKSRVKKFFGKLKMALLYGPEWDKGYTAQAGQAPRFPLPHLTYPPTNQTYQSTKRLAEEIEFSIEIQKIRGFDLFVVEFRRLSGGIWEFKRMYEEVMADPDFALLIESKYE